MIFIRVDANETIATGHLMRCMSIAKALQKRQEECLFLLGEPYSIPTLEKNHLPYLCLNFMYNEKQKELSTLLNIMKEKSKGKKATILLDSYEVTPSYIEELESVARVLYIDDFGQISYPATAVVNYNISANEQKYEQLYKKEKTILYLGLLYAPLREEFQVVEKKEIRQQIKDILITSGGADQYNLAFQIVTYLMQHEKQESYHYHIVSGMFNRNLPLLEEMTRKEKRVSLYVNYSNMAKLMRSVDVCISAGGSTLVELCACQTPTISFAFADNQLPMVTEYERLGIIPYAGDARTEQRPDLRSKVETINPTISRMKSLLDTMTEERRKKYSMGMEKVVDGRGADRIADIICNL